MKKYTIKECEKVLKRKGFKYIINESRDIIICKNDDNRDNYIKLLENTLKFGDEIVRIVYNDFYLLPVKFYKYEKDHSEMYGNVSIINQAGTVRSGYDIFKFIPESWFKEETKSFLPDWL